MRWVYYFSHSSDKAIDVQRGEATSKDGKDAERQGVVELGLDLTFAYSRTWAFHERALCRLPRGICGLAWSGRVYGGQAHGARSRHLCRINRRKERATRFWLALPLILSMMSSVYGVLPTHPGSVLKASQALLFHLDFHFTTIILIFQIRNWVQRRSHLSRGTKLSSRAVFEPICPARPRALTALCSAVRWFSC